MVGSTNMDLPRNVGLFSIINTPFKKAAKRDESVFIVEFIDPSTHCRGVEIYLRVPDRYINGAQA